MFTHIFIWIILSYGLTNIVVYGGIFKWLRDWLDNGVNNKNKVVSKVFNFFSDLVGCPMCFSTWVGFFLGLFIMSPTKEFFDTDIIYSWFFDGIFSSGAVWAIHSIIEWFEENRPNKTIL